MGLIATLLFGVLGIYSGFFYSRTPNLAFQEIANTPVFAINERVEQLEVLYRGRELASSGKTLTLLQLRAVNDGTAPILQAYYDARALPGLRVQHAEILKANVVSASNQYLRSNLSLVVGVGTVTFKPVIMEPSDYFVVKLLLLHDRDISPSLSALGKIAGIRAITYVPLEFQKAPSVLTVAFSGGPLVQILRLPAYFVGAVAGTFLAVILIFALGLAPGVISHRRATRRRRRYVAQALAGSNAIDPLFRHFLQQYERYGSSYLREVLRTLKSPAWPSRPADRGHSMEYQDFLVEQSRRPIEDLLSLDIVTLLGSKFQADKEKAAHARRVIGQVLRNAPK